ncbi:MAG TPA: hypothetical protein VMF90_26360 [Rhizobiaceae bacterium]|nr:hypothetical protein [Rhizobiaceae bacterium]
MILLRAVDSVDVYLRIERRHPGVIQEDNLRRRIDGAGRSIFEKVVALEGRYGSGDPVAFAMVFVMIAWRNKSAHEEADATLDVRHKDTLRTNEGVVQARYRGLEVERLLSRFETAEPTFKEAASLVGAAQGFVEFLERRLFRDLDTEKYLKELLWSAPAALSSGEANRYRKRRFQSVWGRDASDRQSAVIRHLREFGITDKRRDDEVATFGSSKIRELCGMTPNEVYGWAKPDAEPT